MANITTSESYYDQVSHAARPGTQYVTTTGTAISLSSGFAGLYVVSQAKFSSISSVVTGFSGLANSTAGNAVTIDTGVYLAGTCTGFTLHSGVVLAIGD
jgi:hypothetical protein